MRARRLFRFLAKRFRLWPEVCHERGSTLAMVLFPLVIAALIAVNLASAARTELLINRNVEHAVQRRLAEEAAINRSIIRLLGKESTNWLVPDGRITTYSFGGMSVNVALVRETAKINLNAIHNPALINLLKQSCVDPTKAEAIADALADYVDDDDVRRPRGMEKAGYAAAALPYVPRNSRFNSLDEVRRVPGLPDEIFERIRPFVTVYSYADTPDLALADPAILSAVLNVDYATARAQRLAAPPVEVVGGPKFAGIVTLSAWVDVAGHAEPGLAQTLYLTGQLRQPLVVLDRQQDITTQHKERVCGRE